MRDAFVLPSESNYFLYLILFKFWPINVFGQNVDIGPNVDDLLVSVDIDNGHIPRWHCSKRSFRHNTGPPLVEHKFHKFEPERPLSLHFLGHLLALLYSCWLFAGD